MLVRRIVIFAAFPYGLLLCALLGVALPPGGAPWASSLLTAATSIFPHLRVALAAGHGIDEVYLWLIAMTISLVIAVWASLLSRERSFGVACAVYAGLTLTEIIAVALLVRLYGDPWGLFQSNLL